MFKTRTVEHLLSAHFFRSQPKTALSKIMRRRYLIIYQQLLETVKITEPCQDFQGIF